MYRRCDKDSAATGLGRRVARPGGDARSGRASSRRSGVNRVGSDCDRHGAVAVSQDSGLTWEPALGSTLGGPTQLDVVVSNPAGFVAYGQTGSGGIGVWTSPDGLIWRAASTVAHTPDYSHSWVSAAVPFGPGTVLVGGSAAAADSLRSDVLVSGDGMTLRRAPWAPQMAEPTMAAAVAWNGRLYVVGAGGAFFVDPAVPILWTAELRATP